MATTSYKIACLKEAARNLPEYASIAPFFIDLYRYVDQAGRDTGISFRDAGGRQRVVLENGFPLLAPADLAVDTSVCTAFLNGALIVLGRAGQDGGAELEKIARALDRGALDLAALFRSILGRDRAELDSAAAAIAVPSSLLEYVMELPLKSALESYSAGIPPESCEDWHEGYCPVCGSRAGMAELAGEDGRRFLCCSACTFRWPFKRLQCPFCGNEETGKLSYFTAGEGATRVDTCSACSRYIKTRDSRKGNAEVPLEIEDLLTIHLDLLASREGFERGK